MVIKTTFRSHYEVEIPAELPSSGLRVRYFPEVESRRGRLYEASLRFTYMGAPSWWGVFAARSKRGEGLDVVSSMPEPDACCVIACGTGYVVDVREPDLWQMVELYPILDVNAILDRQLLVLNDFTRLLAYGVGGSRWRAEGQCSDQLKIIRADSERITYTGWDAASDEEVTGHIDTKSGERVPG
jgi:hypothetical protein